MGIDFLTFFEEDVLDVGGNEFEFLPQDFFLIFFLGHNHGRI